jgi:hypothetical protein
MHQQIFYKMEYNTLQKKIILPEYGRHVQMMVLYAVQIKDREERNAAARTIIGIMGNLQPQLRDLPDFKHKLWDHLFIMSDFKLDIDAPYPMPSPDTLEEKPDTVPYTQSHIHRKHYGKILTDMIREAGKMEDSELRDGLVQSLILQMKKSYMAWNRSEISTEQITQDLWDLTDGKIVLNPDLVQFVGPVRENQLQPGKNRKRRLIGSSRK